MNGAGEKRQGWGRGRSVGTVYGRRDRHEAKRKVGTIWGRAEETGMGQGGEVGSGCSCDEFRHSRRERQGITAKKQGEGESERREHRQRWWCGGVLVSRRLGGDQEGNWIKDRGRRMKERERK